MNEDRELSRDEERDIWIAIATREPELYEKPGIPRAVIGWVFVATLVILSILAAALLIATPRSALEGDPSRSRTPQALTGAPPSAEVGSLAGTRGRSAVGGAPLAGPPETHIGEPLFVPDTATDVSGTASWFCGGGSACTKGYPPGTFSAAAGPALRVGDWRGRIVKVCSARACVKVALNDWCACPRRVIDLYRVAFARIANPSRGLVRVTVTWGGRAIVVPPTDTR